MFNNTIYAIKEYGTMGRDFLNRLWVERKNVGAIFVTIVLPLIGLFKCFQ